MTFLDKEGVSTLWDKTKELVNDVPIKKGEGKNSVVIGNFGIASGTGSVCFPSVIYNTILQIREVTQDDINKDPDAKNFKYIEVENNLDYGYAFKPNNECIVDLQHYQLYKITDSNYSEILEVGLFNTDKELDLSNSYYEARSNVASGNSSHAEGYCNTASGDYSHAEGTSTKASGYSSHAEGTNTTASGNSSHAEGTNTTASGDYSHAEGASTKASGYSSHAEGASTKASGKFSHAEGTNTTASGDYSHVSGRYNVPSKFSIHQIGIGQSGNSLKNAEEIFFDDTSNNNNGKKYLINIGGYTGNNLYTDTDGTVLNTNVKSVQEVINELQSTVEELKKQANKRIISRYQTLRYVKETVSNVDVEAQNAGTVFSYIVYDTVKNIFLAYNNLDKKYYSDWSARTSDDTPYNQSGNFGYRHHNDSVKAYAVSPSRSYVYFIISENKYYSADEKGVLEEIILGEDITSYNEVGA